MGDVAEDATHALLEWLCGLHKKVHDAMGMYKRNSGPHIGVEMGLESVPRESNVEPQPLGSTGIRQGKRKPAQLPRFKKTVGWWREKFSSACEVYGEAQTSFCG